MYRSSSDVRPVGPKKYFITKSGVAMRVTFRLAREERGWCRITTYNEYWDINFVIRPKTKSLWFLVFVRVTSDCALAFLVFFFLFFAMKRCPIAAKIAGLIGILPCCVLNDSITLGIWTFARFVRPLLATILCVWKIWSGSNNRAQTCITYFTGWQNKIPPPPQKKKKKKKKINKENKS